jgi:hypothetical protein
MIKTLVENQYIKIFNSIRVSVFFGSLFYQEQQLCLGIPMLYKYNIYTMVNGLDKRVGDQ